MQMNEEMAEKLIQATSAADVQAIANSYGKELTMEQAQEALDKIQSFNADGELSDDALEAVTGGGIIATVEEWFTVALPALFR